MLAQKLSLVEHQLRLHLPLFGKRCYSSGMSSSSSDPSICHVLAVVDGNTEEVVDVHLLEPFDLHAFCQQFDVPVEHDPQMLDRYAVGPDDVAFIHKVLEIEIPFDFGTHAYFIEAVRREEA